MPALSVESVSPPSQIVLSNFSFGDRAYFSWPAQQAFPELGGRPPEQTNPSVPTVTLYRLPQMHGAPWAMDLSPRWQEKIFESQWRIANFLQKHPHSLVIDEGLPCGLNYASIVRGIAGVSRIAAKYGGKIPPISDLAPQDKFYVLYDEGCHGLFAAETLAVFPQGLPARPEDFNERQRYLFMSIGAARTLGYLGVLPGLYRACTPEELQARDQKAAQCVEAWGPGFLSSHAHDPTVRSEFYDKAEAQLRREVEQLTTLARERGVPIVAVFGAKHTLAGYFSDSNIYSFRIPVGFPAEGVLPQVALSSFSEKDWLLVGTGSAIAFATGWSWRRRKTGQHSPGPAAS